MKNIDYFVSYTVVYGNNTNSAGHVYLVFSQLDTTLRNARAQVTEAIGFYGHSLRKDQTIKRKIFPAELYGPGHLIQEHLRFIVETEKYSHQHKTWQISESQKDALLQSIAKDREEKQLPKRNFRDEKVYWDSLTALEKSNTRLSQASLEKLTHDEYMSINDYKGPFFNFYRNTCMTDAKKRLNQIGISTKQMDGYIFDIPGLTSGPLDEMKLEYNNENGNIYWKSPLTLSINENKTSYTRDEEIRIMQLRAFSILYAFASKLKDRFHEKNLRLQERGKILPPLVDAEVSVSQITNKLTEIALYPNTIGSGVNLNYQFHLRQTIEGCYDRLNCTNADASIVNLVKAAVDFINHFFHYISSWFIENGHFLGAHPLKFSQHAINTVTEMTQEIQWHQKAVCKINS
tara:strand:+ start:11712 stop:12920 length:1209 start_codon:yes stop_codon:yes gene_type:complete